MQVEQLLKIWKLFDNNSSVRYNQMKTQKTCLFLHNAIASEYREYPPMTIRLYYQNSLLHICIALPTFICYCRYPLQPFVIICIEGFDKWWHDNNKSKWHFQAQQRAVSEVALIIKSTQLVLHFNWLTQVAGAVLLVKGCAIQSVIEAVHKDFHCTTSPCSKLHQNKPPRAAICVFPDFNLIFAYYNLL